MLSLTKPSPAAIQRFLTQQAELGLTYAAVGATAATPPVGYVIDRTRTKLGTGDAVFAAAVAALRRWEQFRMGWIEAWPNDAPLQTGTMVAVVARAGGLWWLNACRVVYTVDETEPIRRFGFAYGTLPAHAGTGEERFLIEWDRATNEVFYEVFAFSRMTHPLTRMVYPIVRRTQRRFGRESGAAMLRAVREDLKP